MRTFKQNLDILNIICKHYEFVLDNWTFVSVVLRDRNGMIVDACDTITNLVNKLLIYDEWFRCTNEPGNHLVRNIFYGCKTLEEVLITRDMNINKV